VAQRTAVAHPTDALATELRTMASWLRLSDGDGGREGRSG